MFRVWGNVDFKSNMYSKVVNLHEHVIDFLSSLPSMQFLTLTRLQNEIYVWLLMNRCRIIYDHLLCSKDPISVSWNNDCRYRCSRKRKRPGSSGSTVSRYTSTGRLWTCVTQCNFFSLGLESFLFIKIYLSPTWTENKTSLCDTDRDIGSEKPCVRRNFCIKSCFRRSRKRSTRLCVFWVPFDRGLFQ